MDKLIDSRKVAERLGISRGSVYHLVLRRRMPYKRLGAKLVFTETEIERFVENLPGIKL